MSDWREVRLGELADVTSSKRIFYSDYVDSGVPFWRSKEVIERFNRKEISTDLFITRDKYSEIKGKFGVPKMNDILLTSVGTLGIPYLVGEGEEFYFKDGNLTWIRNIDGNRLNPKYLYLWLSSQNGRDALREITIGSTQEALTIVGLKGLSFLLPSVEEQKSIASVFSSLDDKIDLLHNQNKTLEAMAEALFRQWFVEGAGDWGEGVLGDVAVNVKDAVNASNIPADIKYIGLEHIDRRNIALNQHGFGSDVSSNKYAFAKNDILFGKLRPYFHKVCFAPFNGICSTDILVVRPKRSELFAYCLFAFFQNDVVEYANLGSGGTRMPRTDWGALKTYPILIPDSGAIERFNEVAMPSIEKIASNIEQIKSLEKLRDLLLPKLMSGEVRVG